MDLIMPIELNINHMLVRRQTTQFSKIDFNHPPLAHNELIYKTSIPLQAH